VTKRNCNIVKVFWLFLLCIGIIFFSSNNSQALPLTNVSIGWSNVDPYLSVYGQQVYTDYTFYADQIVGGPAFCVEYIGINQSASYELIAVPTQLSTAANIASQFFYNATFNYKQAATQIAIWEIVFDDSNLGSGNVTYGSSGSLYDDIKNILSLYTNSLEGPIGLAHAPASGTTKESQDYLVSVPDASIMFLLGPALLGLGLLGRRRKPGD
jgi:hypothetical protein